MTATQEFDAEPKVGEADEEGTKAEAEAEADEEEDDDKVPSGVEQDDL